MSKQRATVWCAGLITCVIAAIANTLMIKYFETDVFTLNVEVLIPVGAAILAAAAASGFYFAIRSSGYQTDRLDLVLLFACSVGFFLLIYLVEYWVLAGASNGRWSSYYDFLNHAVTDARYRIHDTRGLAGVDGLTDPIGRAGWAMMIPRFAVLLVVFRQVHAMFQGGGAEKWSE